MNPDGSGLTLILDRSGASADARAYRYQPSPTGGTLALLEIEDRNTLTTPELSLLELPEGRVTPITKLLPGDIDLDALERPEYEQALDRWAAVGMWNRMAWSPDGRWLAFNGAQDGPSSDLYLYSVANGSTTRLTDGPTESVSPVWSPDGQRIVHGAVERLYFDYSGSGYQYTSVWLVEADGSGVKLLFNSQIVGFEEVLGWLSNTTLLMDTNTPNENPFCGYHDLRTVDVESGDITPVMEAGYIARDFDPESRTVLFGVVEDPYCEADLQPGLYVLDVESGLPPLRFVEDEAYEVVWSPEAALFFVKTEHGALAADGLGQFIDLVVPEETVGLPLVAPGSRQLAWTGDELWIGTLSDEIDKPPRRIFSGHIWEARWSPDGEQLLFITGDGVYVAESPDFTPTLVIEMRGWDPVLVPSP